MDLTFIPGSASLAEGVDSRVMVWLRDGKSICGVLRSFDQFGNIVVEQTSERLFVTASEQTEAGMNASNTAVSVFAEKPLGLYLVRGENVACVAETSPEGLCVPKYDRRGEVQRLISDEHAELEALGFQKQDWAAVKALRERVDKWKHEDAIKKTGGASAEAIQMLTNPLALE